MKRTLLILMGVVLCLSISACGMSEAARKKKAYDQATKNLEKSRSKIAEIERELDYLEGLQRDLDSVYGK